MAKVEGSADQARAAIRWQIDKMYREGVAHGDDSFEKSLYPVSVTPGRGKFLGDLVRRFKPQATIEIGMGWGLSTLHLMEAMFENGGTFQPHVIMDPFQESTFHNGARRALREVGAEPFVDFHQEASEVFLPQLIREGRQFDFAFIDGDHRFDGTFVDLVLMHKLLKPGGVMALDDTELDAVHLACRFAKDNLGYTFEAGHTDREGRGRGRHRNRGSQPRPQVSAYRKPLDEIERGQLHFVSFFDDFTPLLRINRLASNRLAHEGLTALRAGDPITARRAFREALRHDPAHAKNLFRYLRTYLPRTIANAVSGRTSDAPVAGQPPSR